MAHAKRSLRPKIHLIACMALLVACNDILGIKKYEPRPTETCNESCGSPGDEATGGTTDIGAGGTTSDEPTGGTTTDIGTGGTTSDEATGGTTDISLGGATGNAAGGEGNATIEGGSGGEAR